MPRKFRKFGNNRNSSSSKAKQGIELAESGLKESQFTFDKINMEILKYILNNPHVKSTDIAKGIKVPLSTIQRRKGRIENSSILRGKFEIDYARFGMRTADLLIKVSKLDTEKIIEEIVKEHSKNLLEISIRIGQPEINLVVRVVYKDSDEIWKIMRSINTVEHVERIQWSEIVKMGLKNQNDLVENFFSVVGPKAPLPSFLI
ncbi:Lrp/AsnC family transcriptional regulator [Candidatus Nitrosocosmicus hydrocola]|uniref:Lrp/AsnC family transcriptional regulator n=1 Tax=Candidatus Nitrosocosmicus hydrocola TaxID=1826872 RepID=UPI0011E59123|nr:Lrp/AsnC family transcriptional regulator [Candidatus Nitrosocosmicus hydrocola]